MTIRARDLHISVRNLNEDDDLKLKMTLTYRPTGVQVGGKGNNFQELKEKLLAELEDLVADSQG